MQRQCAAKTVLSLVNPCNSESLLTFQLFIARYFGAKKNSLIKGEMKLVVMHGTRKLPLHTVVDTYDAYPGMG